MIILIQLLHLCLNWFLHFTVPAEFFIYPFLTSQGLVPYSQIIDHHFPGLFFLPINFYSLGFRDPYSLKILLLLVILLTSVFLSRLASRRIAWFTVSLYAFWQLFFSGSLLWIDIFLPIFLIPGLILFEDRKFLASGTFFALAVLFKQTAILPFLFLGLYLIKLPRSLFWFYLPLGLLLLSLCLYFFRLHALTDFLWWNFFFNLKIYPAASFSPPGWSDWIRISLPLFLYLYSFILAVKHKQHLAIKLSVLVALLSAPALNRFGLEYFQSAVPFFCLLLALVFPDRLKIPILILSCFWAGFFLIRLRPVDTGPVPSLPHSSVFSLGASPLVYSQNRIIPPGRFFFFPLPWLYSLLEQKQLQILRDLPPEYIVFNPQSRVGDTDIFTSAPGLVQYLKDNYLIESTVSGQLIYHRL